MKKIMDESQISQAIQKLASDIISEVGNVQEFVVIGIRSRGEVLGQRLAVALTEKLGREIPNGTVDITLHRDDVNEPAGGVPKMVGITELPFDIDGKVIVLADDVLHTGRSCRAAMDALVGYGRPAKIRLAVLVDRGQREFPIQADYAAKTVEADESEIVKVHFVESDGKDEVTVQKVQ